MARIIGREVALDFDDVMIVPKYNKVLSRRDVNLETQVTRNYKMKIPFIASNMPDICESEMAIAMYNEGGLGVLHRFMTTEQAAEEVRKLQNEGLSSGMTHIGARDMQGLIAKVDFTEVSHIVNQNLNLKFFLHSFILSISLLKSFS